MDASYIFLPLLFLIVSPFLFGSDSFQIELQDKGYVAFEENSFLEPDEIDSCIGLLQYIQKPSAKHHPEGDAVSKLFLFKAGKGRIGRNLTIRHGEIPIPDAIQSIMLRLLQALGLEDERCLVETVLADDFKRRSPDKTEPWRIGWHRDVVAGSCHPFISVFCLETRDIPEHNFLLGRVFETTEEGTLFECLHSIPVEVGKGYLIHEEFEPFVYHATEILSVFGEKPSRKTLIFRIAHKSSPSYEMMKTFYRERSSYLK